MGRKNSRKKDYRIPETASHGDYGKIADLRNIKKILSYDASIGVVSFDFMNTLVYWTDTLAERHGRMMDTASSILQHAGLFVSLSDYKRIYDQHWCTLAVHHRRHGTDFKVVDALESIVKEAMIQSQRNKGVNPAWRPPIRSERDALDIGLLYLVTQLTLGERPSAHFSARFLAERIADSMYRIERETATLTPGVREILKVLRRKKIPAVVYSNTPFSTAHVQETLRELGIAQEFDRILASSDFGYQKSARVSTGFETFAAELVDAYDLSPGNRGILHVGDNKEEDYRGALNAGLAAVYFPRKSQLGLRGKDIANEAYIRLNESLEDGRYEDAKKYARQFISWEAGDIESIGKNHVRSTKALFKLGEAYRLLGRNSEARYMYRLFVDLPELDNPRYSHAVGYLMIADTYEMEERFKEADAALVSARKRDPLVQQNYRRHWVDVSDNGMEL